MLLGLMLLYVGAVLFLNGLWLLGRIDDREIVVINVVAGLVAAGVAIQGAFGAGATPQTVRTAAITILFATTYLWVAHNRLAAVDGRGLGWFSIFVVISIIPTTLQAFTQVSGAFDLWLALCWGTWAVLWFMYFLLLALGRPILRATAWVTLLAGVFTGWLPGLVLLHEWA